MKTLKNWSPAVLVVIAIAALMALVPGKSVQAAKPGGRQCPMVYAPVICDGGRVYSNQCFADRAHARNCVPLGGI